MTEPNDKLVDKLARMLCRMDHNSDPDGPLTQLPGDKTSPKIAWQLYQDDAAVIVRTILTRENLAAYQRGLRDAAAICDEVAKGKIWDVGAIEAAERIRERMS